MEKQDVSTRIDELVEYARMLDASFDDQNQDLLASVAAQLRVTVSPLYVFFEVGPKPWRNAMSGAWVAMKSAGSVQEQLALSKLDWARVGAAVSFTVSGVEQLCASWNQIQNHAG
jgi:hypothetical protein